MEKKIKTRKLFGIINHKFTISLTKYRFQFLKRLTPENFFSTESVRFCVTILAAHFSKGSLGLRMRSKCK